MTEEIKALEVLYATAADSYDAACEALQTLIKSDRRHYNSSGIPSMDTPEASAAHAKIAATEEEFNLVSAKARAAGYKFRNGKAQAI